jgi:hypothetical protein
MRAREQRGGGREGGTEGGALEEGRQVEHAEVHPDLLLELLQQQLRQCSLVAPRLLDLAPGGGVTSMEASLQTLTLSFGISYR